MIELKESNVLFNEDEHRYYIGAKEISGITGRIKEKCCPSMDFSFASAQVGTDAHRDIEGVNLSVKFGIDAFTTTKHGENYHAWLMQDALTIVDSEYIVTDGNRYASPIDIVFEDKCGNVVLCDIKTYKTYTSLYKTMCRWQLSIYAYLFELVNGYAPHSAFVLQVTEDGCTEHEVELYSTEMVVKFLYDDDFSPYTMQTNSNTLQKTVSLSNFVETMQEQIKSLEKDLESLKSQLLNEMQENGFTKVEQDNMTFTYVAPSVTTSFDSNAFLLDHPEYEGAYIKETTRKAYLRITKKK